MLHIYEFYWQLFGGGGGGAQTMTKIIFFKEILSSNYICLFKNQKIEKV